MSINGLFFDERFQKAIGFRALFENILSDGILNGCALSNTTSSMTVGVGFLNIAGGLIYVDAAETTSIVGPTGNYVRFYFKIDLTQTAQSGTFLQGSIEYDYSSTIAGFTALTQGDINVSDTTYEQEIAIYSLSGGNISALIRSIPNSKVIVDSWIPVLDTWTRVSDTSASVPAGGTSRYKKLWRVKFTQHGTTKDGYLTSVADTAIGFYGGSDYVIEDTTTYPITDIYISNEVFPDGCHEWLNFTPTFANITKGAGGTYLYKLRFIGKTCMIQGSFTFGTGSAITGTPRITLPFTAANVSLALPTVYILDNGTAWFVGTAIWASTSEIDLSVMSTGSTYAGPVAISATVPMTWANSDRLFFNIVYETNL